MKRALPFALVLAACVAAPAFPTPSRARAQSTAPSQPPSQSPAQSPPQSPAQSPAQTPPPKSGTVGPDSAAPKAGDATPAGAQAAGAGAEGKSAQALHEEAASYARRKFDEFEKNKLPYNRQLEQKTVQEQRDLALRYATALAAREPLAGADFYHLGQLYALAGKGDMALSSLRRFLSEEPAGAPDELRQKARVAAVQQAAQAELAEEAEKYFADYRASTPRNSAEVNRMAVILASLQAKKQNHARAAEHARDAYAAALELSRGPGLEPRQRDAAVFGAGAFLSNTLLKAGRRADALKVIQEMRGLSIAFPSARLYRNATMMLLDNREGLDAPPAVEWGGAGEPPRRVVGAGVLHEADLEVQGGQGSREVRVGGRGVEAAADPARKCGAQRIVGDEEDPPLELATGHGLGDVVEQGGEAQALHTPRGHAGTEAPHLQFLLNAADHLEDVVQRIEVVVRAAFEAAG